MNKCYESIGWKNGKEGGTALGAFNLDKVDAAVNEIDNRVVEMDSVKMNRADLRSSGTVEITETEGKLYAEIAKNAVTDEHIESHYLANIKAESSKAETASASASESAQSAKEASKNAQNMLDQVNKKLNIVEFEMDGEGNIVYPDNSAYRFLFGDDGILYYEITV